jgi:hypothetical protein
VILPPALAAISGAGLTGWMGACGLGAVVLALALGFARALRIRYVVTERGVERSSPWSHRKVVMAWSDVTELASVQFLDESGSPTASWCFMLRGIASGQWTTFEIPEAMNGVGDFAREALFRLPQSVLATNPVAVESLERLRVGPT